MDHQRFDRLARALSVAGSRRGLVRLLAALPLGAMLASRLPAAPDASSESGDHGSSHRRHRRKAKHRHQTGNNKENHKGQRKGKRKSRKKCQPESLAQTCANSCGPVTNNCGNAIDCGPCPVCQTCTATGTCVPANEGAVCGTQSATGGGEIRCCRGECPDPDCLPPNQPCLSGDDCFQRCCIGGGSFDGSNWTCNNTAIPGNSCGSDLDCSFGGICLCEICCFPSAATPIAGLCGNCCSGSCNGAVCA